MLCPDVHRSQLLKQSNVQKVDTAQIHGLCSSSLAPAQICNRLVTSILLSFHYFSTLVIRPVATVLPPSRMLNLDPVSITVG